MTVSSLGIPCYKLDESIVSDKIIFTKLTLYPGDMLYKRKLFLHHCIYLLTSIAKSCPKFGGGAGFCHIAPLLELYCHFSPEMKGTETTSVSTMSLMDSLYVGGVKIKAPSGLNPPLYTVRILIRDNMCGKLTSGILLGIYHQHYLASRI